MLTLNTSNMTSRPKKLYDDDLGGCDNSAQNLSSSQRKSRWFRGVLNVVLVYALGHILQRSKAIHLIQKGARFRIHR